MTFLKLSTFCLNVDSVNWIDGLLELWLLNEIFVYKYNFYVFTWEVVLSIKLIWVLHINKWLSIKDRVSGWGQSFVPSPPPPTLKPIVYHMWMQSYVSFSLVTSVWKDVETFSPPSSLCLVLLFFYLAC